MFDKVISIEIGLLKTKICEVDYQKKSPHVYNCISFDTPKNTYEDGYIKDKDTLVKAIQNNIKETKIKSNRLVFTLSSTKIANREVIIPAVKEQRIKDVVKANAGEYFPVDISEYVISYSLLEKLTQEEEKKFRLLVLAAPDIMVKAYYDMAQMLGYQIAAIDYMGNSTYQLTKRSVGTDISMVVQMNEQITFLNILENGLLSLPRAVTYGVMSIADALMDSKSIKVASMEEALGLLYSEQLIGGEQDTAQDEAAATEQIIIEDSFNKDMKDALREEATASLQYLINNIARILDYYARNYKKKINTIYIIGQAQMIVGLSEYLYNELGIEVKVIDSLSSVVFKKGLQISAGESAGFISCIGAAIKPVGFIPKDYFEKIQRNSNIHAIVFIFVAGVALSIALVLISYFTYKNELLRNDRLNNDIDSLSVVNKVYEDNQKAIDWLDKVEGIYDMTTTPNEEFNNLLYELEDKLPKNAIVSSLNVSSEGLTFDFAADTEVTAAKVLQQLKSISALSQISTSGIELAEDDNGIMTATFVVNAVYVTQEPSDEDDGANQ